MSTQARLAVFLAVLSGALLIPALWVNSVTLTIVLGTFTFILAWLAVEDPFY